MDLPKAGQFVGSDAQGKLLKRGYKSLVYGRCANGDTWDMPVANRDGILKYKKAVKDEREAAKAGGLHADRTHAGSLQVLRGALILTTIVPTA